MNSLVTGDALQAQENCGQYPKHLCAPGRDMQGQSLKGLNNLIMCIDAFFKYGQNVLQDTSSWHDSAAIPDPAAK